MPGRRGRSWPRGNAAEHWVSVYFAVRNKIDLSINIAMGSAAQIAPDGAGVQITQRGDTTWFEGLQLLAVYAVLALTFFFV
jgi:Ca2+:H+ antiporter